MNELTYIFLAFCAGILLGLFFFGGLWWTTKKGLVSKIPMLWFFGSLIIRLSVTILGFYYISRNHWELMMVCLLGFIVARTIITKYTQQMEVNHNAHQGG